MRTYWYRPLLALLLLAPIAPAAVRAADTPLVAAIKHNDLAKTRALLKGATRDMVSLALFNAVGFNAKPAIVSLLLQHGADVSAQLASNHATPLHYAALDSTPAVMALLLKRGANIDATDQDLQTPLEWAAQDNRRANVRYLLMHGANGPNALVDMTYWKKPEAVSALLDAGVEVNARATMAGKKGETALIESTFVNDIGLARLLLDHGADANAVQPGDDNMTTPLMFAAYHCNSDMIALLASHGARDTIRNSDGHNAYDLAQSGWTNDMHPCDSSVLSQLSNLQ